MFSKVKPITKSSNLKEILFQVTLNIVVFVFYSFERHHPRIEAYQLVFFLNYALAALFISYFLLPIFYYRKKHLLFFISVLLTIALVIFMEEAVLERLYFPTTRGKVFLGIFYSLVDVLPVIAILVGFKFAWDATNKQREVDELRSTVRESELQFLKSQINPHFLFNNLNNLYSYAIDNSPKTPAIILELSSVLRYMLYDCKERFVPLFKEIEQLENFTRLNQLQIEERGEVTFNTQNIKAGYRIAPLILIVFIENAFKHSQASQSENIYINVKVSLSDNGILHFNCKNNFQHSTNIDKLSNGIGLENVKKRLTLLYPNAHQLDIERNNNFYEVQLSIDLNESVTS